MSTVRNIGPWLPFHPFPAQILPSPASNFIMEAAAAIGCEESMIALPLLVAMGAAIGTTRRIVLKADWTEPAILWAVVVAPSGSKKSPPFDQAIRPLQQRQRRAFEEHRAKMAEFAKAAQDYEKSATQFRKSDGGELPERPVPPQMRRHVVSDVTVEALTVVLAENPRGVMLARDELSGWFGSFDQYKGGRGGDSAHWLEMFRGGSVQIDRKTAGKPCLYVPRAAVWVAGTIQPSILRKCLGHEHVDNGMASRFLMSCPPPRRHQWSEREVSGQTRKAMELVFDKLVALDFAPAPAEENTPVDIPLDADAKLAWIKYVNEMGEELHGLGGGAVAAAIAKLEGIAARLALIVHVVRDVAGDPALTSAGAVDLVSIQAGIQLARWFANEAKRIYATFEQSDDDRRYQALAQLVESAGGTISVRELMRRRRFGDADQAWASLNGLVERGWAHWLRSNQGTSGGRPSEEIELLIPVDKTPVG